MAKNKIVISKSELEDLIANDNWATSGKNVDRQWRRLTYKNGTNCYRKMPLKGSE